MGVAAAPQTHVELFGYSGVAGGWDGARWDEGAWDAARSWQNVDCLVTSARIGWGADDTLGCLAQSAAGVWQIRTHDPLRKLDPSNPAGAYQLLTVAGTPMRIRFGGSTLRTGYLDELRYAFGDSVGDLAGSDAIAQMAQCETPDAWVPTFTDPSAFTLYALARQAIAAAGLAITVEADPVAGDPQVAFVETEGQNVWQLIRTAATDALMLAYVDWIGRLCFAPFGAPVDNGMVIGDGGICPVDLDVSRTERGIVNIVTDGAGEVGRDQGSINVYGPRVYRVDRREPGSTRWGAAIIADRATAAMEYEPGELRPEDANELVTLAHARANEAVRLVLTADEHAIDVATQYLGGSIAFDAAGDWRGEVRLYKPGSAYTYTPPIATTPGTAAVIATRAAADAYLFLPWAGSATIEPMGAGLNNTIATTIEGTARTVGDPYSNGRALVRFEPDWSGARRYRGARLRLYLNPSFYGPTAPKTLDIRRIIGTWSEGSQALLSPYNAVVWPGPAATDVGRVTPLVGGTLGAYGYREYDVTEIIRALAPRSLGGSGLPDMGMSIWPGAENIDSKVLIGSRESSQPDYAPHLLLDVEV